MSVIRRRRIRRPPPPWCPLGLLHYECESVTATEEHFYKEHKVIEIDGYTWMNCIDFNGDSEQQDGFYVKVATKKYICLQIISDFEIQILIIDLEPSMVSRKAIITFTDGFKKINKHINITSINNYSFQYALNIEIDTIFDELIPSCSDINFCFTIIDIYITFPKLNSSTSALSKSETSMEKLKDPANSVSVTGRMMSKLECPVCKDKMRPPIFLCVIGHSICHKCKPRMKECPLCKASIGDARAFTLEDMCGEFAYPCLNQEYGCTIELVLEQIQDHEKICESAPYICPVCSWKGTYNNLKSHLIHSHGINIYKNIMPQISLAKIIKNVHRNSYIYLEFMNKLHFIKISIGVNKDCEFTTMIVGKKQEPYYYQIVFKNSKDTKINMSKTQKSDRKMIVSKKDVDCIDEFNSILLSCEILKY